MTYVPIIPPTTSQQLTDTDHRDLITALKLLSGEECVRDARQAQVLLVGLTESHHADVAQDARAIMQTGLAQQKAAVESGHWTLMRYNPALATEGKNPLSLDSKAPKISLKDYAYKETRYSMLTKSNPEAAERLMQEAEAEVKARWQYYEQLAGLSFGDNDKTDEESA